MELYSTPASPFARKVRVLAAETGQDRDIAVKNVTLTPTEPAGELVAHNPAGKVPALVTGDGAALVDSRVICEYLDHRHDGPRMFPAAGPDRWRALAMQALGDAIMDAGVLLRYERHVRPAVRAWTGWEDAQAGKIHRTLATLEDRVPDPGDDVHIGLIAVGCALGYLDFRFPDRFRWRGGHPGLAGWHEAFADRPAMRATAPGPPARVSS